MVCYQRLLSLCLYVLLTQLPLQILADVFRCYSCTWNAVLEKGNARQEPCRSAEDIRVIDSDSNKFVSDANCIRCMKSEIWAGGELQSVMRSCMQQNSQMYAQDPGCTQEESESQVATSCFCDGDLCNRAGSLLARHDLWTLAVWLVLLHFLILGR